MKSKVIIIGLLLAVLMTAAVSALDFDWQSYSSSIKEGDILANVGIGFGTPSIGKMVIPPIQASVEYVIPVLGFPTSFGALVGFTTSAYDYFYGTYNYTGIAMAARASWHIDLGIDKLDTYSSLALGYFKYLTTYTPIAGYEGWSINETDYSSFYYGVNVGARYFFTPSLGASIELGYSALSYIAAGLTLKF